MHYIADNYNDICMLQRNRFMIEHSARCIAYFVQPYGGTAYTMRLAKKKQVVVYNLADTNRNLT